MKSRLSSCCPTPRALAQHRAARRASSGGGVMFIVAMTLAVLAGLGAWALQSAALEVRMAGYERQNTQTHYVSEYGVLAAMQNVGANPTIVTVAKQTPATDCWSVPTAADTSANASGLACFRWDNSQAALSALPGSTYAAPPGLTFYSTPSSGPYAIDPSSTSASGSLGYTSLQGDFRVELSEPAAGPPLPGGGTQYWVTISSYGQTGLSADAGAAQFNSQGNETLRARVLVPVAPGQGGGGQ
jgi:hypothetical protein